MKIMKSYRQWIWIIGIPLLIVSGIILYFPLAAVQVFKLHWLAILVLLIFVCGPWRNRRLAADEVEPPRYTRQSWLLQIFILQLCLGAIFLGICVCCGQSAPVITPVQTALFQQTMREILVAQILFPWGFFAITAILMGYYAYHLREDAYWATILAPIISNPLLKITLNFIARFVTILAYGLCICLISLLWASMATVFPIVTGFNLTPLLVTLILLGLSFSKIFRRNLTKSLGKEIPLSLGLFFWTVFFAAAIWLLNGFLAPWTHIAMTPPTLLNHWLNSSWRILWLIFAQSYWLLWTPLIGITLARISRGYRVWEMTAAIFILPLCAACIFYFTRHKEWDIAPIYAGLIAALGLFILFIFTLRAKATPSFILAYLPRQDHYKFRSYRHAFVNVAQAAVIILFIYLPSGIFLINFLLYAAALLVILIVFVSLKNRRNY